MQKLISDRLYIKDAPIGLVRTLVEEAQIINPEYVNAKRYSKYNVTRIPEFLDFSNYSPKERLLDLPLHFKSENLPDGKIFDKREKHFCTYPPHIELRDTQKDAVDAYVKNSENGIIILPTGKGKSITALAIAAELKQRTLILVHTTSILDGWLADTDLFFNGKLTPGVIQAKKSKAFPRITIAMVQSLIRKSEEELRDLFSNFGLLVADEMHHTPARSYDLLDFYNGFYRLGITATPERSDGMEKLMYWHFGNVCYEFVSDKTDQDILPVKVVIREIPHEFTPIVKYKGKDVLIDSIPAKIRPDYPFMTLDDKVVMGKVYRNAVLKDVEIEYKKKHKIVLFFLQKAHVREYARLLQENFEIPEEDILLFYGDSKEKLVDLKSQAEKMPITLTTYAMAGEGTNVKAWEVAFLVSSSANAKRAVQAIGRVRRVMPGKMKYALVYDYSLPNVYILKRHIYIRKARYKKLGFTIIGDNYKKFGRGY